MSARILVLDDNVEVAQGVGEILELSGHRVDMVHDGPAAIAAFCNGTYDVGVFDIRMPGMTGVEAYLEIRKHRPNANVIFMSGYADADSVSRAMENGSKGYLSKPFEPEEMLAMVDGVLNSRVIEAA